MTDDPAVAGAELSAGAILSLIASGKARSRSDLIDRLGWSRASVTQRLNLLLASGLVDESTEATPGRGRPTRILRLNTGFGLVLAADVGEKSLRLAVTDLVPRIVAEVRLSKDVGSGPIAVLSAVAEGFDGLLSTIGRKAADVVGIGLSLPAPIDFEAGRVVGPSVMSGWDDFDVRGWLHGRFNVPILVENDVNLMTLSEARRFWPDVAQLFYVKAGTGIGSGIITDGRLQRGAQGAAGDIGHIQINGPSGPLCRCGKLGCVEAYASGWAIARDLRAIGLTAYEARDVLGFVGANDPEALRLVRAAGRGLGEVIACVVSVLNPSVIVIGGTLSGADEHLLAGVRELVYQRSLPLATRNLRIVLGRSGDDAGICGAAQLVIETQFQAGAVDQVASRFGATIRSARVRASEARSAGANGPPHKDRADESTLSGECCFREDNLA